MKNIFAIIAVLAALSVVATAQNLPKWQKPATQTEPQNDKNLDKGKKPELTNEVQQDVKQLEKDAAKTEKQIENKVEKKLEKAEQKADKALDKADKAVEKADAKTNEAHSAIKEEKKQGEQKADAAVNKAQDKGKEYGEQRASTAKAEAKAKKEMVMQRIEAQELQIQQNRDKIANARNKVDAQEKAGEITIEVAAEKRTRIAAAEEKVQYMQSLVDKQKKEVEELDKTLQE